MLYFHLQWLQSLMFFNLQGQDSWPQDFFDEKSQEQGGRLHSSPSYPITGAYIPSSVIRFLLRATDWNSQQN